MMNYIKNGDFSADLSSWGHSPPHAVTVEADLKGHYVAIKGGNIYQEFDIPDTPSKAFFSLEIKVENGSDAITSVVRIALGFWVGNEHVHGLNFNVVESANWKTFHLPLTLSRAPDGGIIDIYVRTDFKHKVLIRNISLINGEKGKGTNVGDFELIVGESKINKKS